MTTFGTYEEPVAAEGSNYRPRDHYGNSAIVVAREYKDSVDTVNGTGSAVIVDIYDLNLKETHLGVLLMTGVLVDGFRPHIGKAPLVVQWDKRTSKSGRDYAGAAPASEGAIEAAKKVYASGDPFAPQLGTINTAEDDAPPF